MARFWPENFHHSTAITRRDILYTTDIVQQAGTMLEGENEGYN